ncbi:MAG TPA: hypothetical protein VGH14_06855 [Solirubrobacterales bacterium]|jgi:hypothetical protein
MAISFSDPETGWSFDCDTGTGGGAPPGGLVLRNIRHRSNNFARDLRLIGIRLKVAELDPSGNTLSTKNVLVTLDSTSFSGGQIQELKPSSTTAPAVPGAGGTFLDRLKSSADEMRLLKSYFNDAAGNYTGYGVRADYTSEPALLAAFTNCEIGGLKVSEIFLFSNYGNTPPHEPSTTLLAARCHPMCSYKMSLNASVDRTKNFQRVESIRFDYRVHLSVDSVLASGSTAAAFPKSNDAGLFRDNDSAAAFTGAGSAIRHLSASRAFSAAAFAAVEKNLVLEVTAPGLARGISMYKDTEGEHWTWDNVHWWGDRGGGTMISTPGAFHAAHMHWRWGAAGTAVRKTIPVIDTTGRPKELVENKEIADAVKGSLLVDPQIWIQTIQVAVTEDDAAIDPDKGVGAAKLCAEDWASPFKGMRAAPREISGGADIVCWYSTEVHRGYTSPAYSTISVWPPGKDHHPPVNFFSKLEGTVFLHGIFFAHEPEVTGLQVGSTEALYWPRSAATIRSAAKWFRDGNS